MKNKEKILLLVIILQAAALIFTSKPVAPVFVRSLPSSDYALVIDDLDADEKAAFCGGAE